MRKLVFVVPVHGRWALAKICLRQLRRTCEELTGHGVRSTAVIVSDALGLRELDKLELGFAKVERDNTFLSRRFNDGIQLATDPKYGMNADFVVPCGSDDWVDHRLFLEPLPAAHEMHGFQHMCFVNETGTEISSTFLGYEGGAGIRIIPRELVAPLGYRPADEDRERGCDTSILRNLRAQHGNLKVRHFDTPPHWIVDWKTKGKQLNSYAQVAAFHRSSVESDPFKVLASLYPEDALEEMRQHYFGAEEEPDDAPAVHAEVVRA